MKRVSLMPIKQTEKNKKTPTQWWTFTKKINHAHWPQTLISAWVSGISAKRYDYIQNLNEGNAMSFPPCSIQYIPRTGYISSIILRTMSPGSLVIQQQQSPSLGTYIQEKDITMLDRELSTTLETITHRGRWYLHNKHSSRAFYTRLESILSRSVRFNGLRSRCAQSAVIRASRKARWDSQKAIRRAALQDWNLEGGLWICGCA